MLALLLLPVGCSSESASPAPGTHTTGTPVLVLSPAAIDFGAIAPGSTEHRDVHLSNEGRAELEVELSLTGGDGSFSLAISTMTLGSDEGDYVELAFTPQGSGAAEASLVVTTNDPDAAVTMVSLTGTGLGPELASRPDPTSLGEVAVGCPISGAVMVRNVGEIEVTIDSFGFANPVFVAVPEGRTLWPDRQTEVDVTATPLALGESEGTLTAETDDGSIYAGTVTVTGVERGTTTDTFVVGSGEADLLVVIEPGLHDGVDLSGQLGEIAAALGDSHRLAVTIGDDGCVPDGWIDSATADFDAELAEMLAVPPGALTTEGLTRALAALSPEALGADGCNEGFLREDAGLYLIGITDEADASPGGWVDYLTELQAKKAAPADLVVNAIAGDWPEGCADAGPSKGWYELAVATDGQYVSLCATDWASQVIDDLKERYPDFGDMELSDFPADGTVHVYVDGDEVTEGWTYHNVDNAVEFADPLPPGTVVEIVYEEGC